MNVLKLAEMLCFPRFYGRSLGTTVSISIIFHLNFLQTCTVLLQEQTNCILGIQYNRAVKRDKAALWCTVPNCQLLTADGRAGFSLLPCQVRFMGNTVALR